MKKMENLPEEVPIMCGFVGCLSDVAKDTGKEYNEMIHSMNKMVVHRGPDDAGYFEDQNITMGFRRLSIIDLEGGDINLFLMIMNVTG